MNKDDKVIFYNQVLNILNESRLTPEARVQFILDLEDSGLLNSPRLSLWQRMIKRLKKKEKT